MNTNIAQDTLKSLKGITYSSLNIRSLYKNLDELKIMLNSADLDLLLLQETNLNDSHIFSMFNIPRYRFFRADRTRASGKERGGGLAMYAGTKYQITLLENMTKCTPDVEIMWVLLELPHTRNTYIANVYRPPDGNVVSALDIIENDIGTIMGNSNPDIVLMGDWNIDVSKRDAASRK